MGGPPSNYEKNFHGNLDELKIWNKIRTQGEIQAGMYRQLDLVHGDIVGLVNYFTFDQLEDIPKDDFNGRVSQIAPLSVVNFKITIVLITARNWVISEVEAYPLKCASISLSRILTYP